MIRPQRSGFTFIDLAAVVFIVAFLAALCAYGVQEARSRARAAACRANLGKIGVALSQYANVHGTLPVVSPAGGNLRLAHSPLALLLPYLPEAPDTRYDSTQPWFLQAPGVGAATIAAYRCPVASHRDPVDSLAARRTHCPLGTLLGTTDYIACKGPSNAWCLDGNASAVPANERGAFEIGRPVRLADISDGLAHTMVVGEGTAGANWLVASKSRYPLPAQGDETEPRVIAYNFWCWPFINTLIEAKETRTAVAGVFGTTAIELNTRPVMETVADASQLANCRSRSQQGPHAASGFRSDHRGGCYFLFADGAAHFVAEDADPILLRSLSTIAGHETAEFVE